MYRFPYNLLSYIKPFKSLHPGFTSVELFLFFPDYLLIPLFFHKQESDFSKISTFYILKSKKLNLGNNNSRLLIRILSYYFFLPHTLQNLLIFIILYLVICIQKKPFRHFNFVHSFLKTNCITLK